MIIAWSLISVIFVSLLSLVGAVLLAINKKLITKLIPVLIAFSSGVLLGSAFLELMPESVELVGSSAFGYILVGFIAFFCIEKLLSWHHHIEGDHDHSEKPIAYLTLIGDGVHNFADGAAIAASFMVSIPLGITTTLAIVAHEIPHELSDFLILIHGGLSSKKALFYNFLSATTAIIGTIFVLYFAGKIEFIERLLIPFAAGNFLYIAASDLVPELLKKRKEEVLFVQIAVLILGILVVPLTHNLWTQN